MPAPPDALRPLLADLSAALTDLYGERLTRLVLYGSHARGEAHDESDVDVLVVLQGEVRPAREIRRMGWIRTEISLAHETTVSVLPVSENDFRVKDKIWLSNARREGMTL